MKETARLIYAVLERNLTPASRVVDALREASEHTTSLGSPREGCCGVP